MTVTYDLTALLPGANAGVVEFAGGYTAHLEGWRDRMARRGILAMSAGHHDRGIGGR